MINMKIYPSGFYGPLGVPQSPAVDSEYIKSRMTAYGIPSRYKVPYSLDAEALFKEFDFRTDLDFSMLERALVQAKKHFCFSDDVKDLTLQQWYELQRTSPEWDIAHADWLKETIEFVSGVPRKLSFNNWSVLLCSPVIEANAKDKPSVNVGLAEIKMHQFIRDWICKPNGLNDLVCSMKVLYGATN